MQLALVGRALTGGAGKGGLQFGTQTGLSLTALRLRCSTLMLRPGAVRTGCHRGVVQCIGQRWVEYNCCQAPRAVEVERALGCYRDGPV